jgi:hypothetical protein
MHRFILSGFALLVILAIMTGGRGDPVALSHADAGRNSADVRVARHIAVAMNWARRP